MLEKLNLIKFLEGVRYAIASANTALEKRIHALETNHPSSFGELIGIWAHPPDQTEKD